MILQSTDRAAASRFLDRQAERGDHPAEGRSYRGVEFKVGADSAFGLIGDLVVFADGAAGFRDAVDASEDESLSGEGRYEDAVADSADGSLADIYLDLGDMAGQFQSLIGSQALGLLALATIDPGTTMVASVIPHERTVEVDISSNLDAMAPGAGASEALEALPGDAIAAAGIPEFGKQLETAVDNLAQKGVPGKVGPGELKSAMRAAGIDPEEVASNLGDAGVFAEGTSKDRVGGALVVEADDPEQARGAVTEVGLFLRRSGTAGVTALRGGKSGFSISDEERFGGRPVVVVTAGARIAIGHGLAPALRSLSTETDPLSGTPAYREAVAALGQTPISRRPGSAAAGGRDGPARRGGFPQGKALPGEGQLGRDRLGR
jgi:Protein of unknown function (DUF3352)